MKTIYKYPLMITDSQFLDAIIIRPLHVGLDPGGRPCMWAEVETDDNEGDTIENNMIVFIVGTGHPIPPRATVYVGSFLERQFVWHVYVGDMK